MPPALWWLGRDLRQDDNPALLAASRQGPVLPVFVIDAATRAQGAASRWRLAQGLRALDAALRQQHGRGLLILEGAPETLLPALAAGLDATAIHHSDWPCPAMAETQDRLRRALEGSAIRLHLHPGHLLLHPGAIRSGSGSAYRVFTPFARALRAHGPDQPVPAPKALTIAAPPPEFDDQRREVGALDLAPDLHSGRAVLARHALPAGESAALARLEDFLDRAGGYAQGRDRPDRDATSGLSEHLALGEISPRRIWAIAAAHQGDRDGIQKFLSELIWREFAWHLLIDFPQMETRPWRPEWQDFPWKTAEDAGLAPWRQARTGVALVDAGLREMRVTGRMHNRVRMVVASWLTKHLLIDWRAGLGHFADSLTDWDPAANAMNWQWVAGCGPDASPFFRIFNPERQAAQFDPKGEYRRRWLLGHDGSDGEEARAYFDAIPARWPVARVWQDGGIDLGAGRAAALGAYEAFRA